MLVSEHINLLRILISIKRVYNKNAIILGNHHENLFEKIKPFNLLISVRFYRLYSITAILYSHYLYSSHCQTSPLLRPEKSAQFEKWVSADLKKLKIATHVLDMMQFIMFVASTLFQKTLSKSFKPKF